MSDGARGLRRQRFHTRASTCGEGWSRGEHLHAVQGGVMREGEVDSILGRAPCSVAAGRGRDGRR